MNPTELLGLLMVPMAIIIFGAVCNLVQVCCNILARVITRPKTNRKSV